MVCRVFKKKNHTMNRGFHPDINGHDQEEHDYMSSSANMKACGSGSVVELDHHHHQPKQNHHHHHVQALYDYTPFDGSVHLPQLFSPETSAPPSLISPLSLNSMDVIECSQNLLRLTSTSGTATHGTGPTCGGLGGLQQQERFNGGDWSFLDKLLASHHNHLQQQDHHHPKCITPPSSSNHHLLATSSHRSTFPFQYLGCCDDTTDFLKFSK